MVAALRVISSSARCSTTMADEVAAATARTAVITATGDTKRLQTRLIRTSLRGMRPSGSDFGGGPGFTPEPPRMFKAGGSSTAGTRRIEQWSLVHARGLLLWRHSDRRRARAGATPAVVGREAHVVHPAVTRVQTRPRPLRAHESRVRSDTRSIRAG